MRGEIKVGTLVMLVNPGVREHEHLAGVIGECIAIEPPSVYAPYRVRVHPCHVNPTGLWNCKRRHLIPIDAGPEPADVDVLATIPNKDDLIVV